MKQYKDPFPVELFESPIIKTSIDFQLYQWQHGGGVHDGFFCLLDANIGEGLHTWIPTLWVLPPRIFM